MILLKELSSKSAKFFSVSFEPAGYTPLEGNFLRIEGGIDDVIWLEFNGDTSLAKVSNVKHIALENAYNAQK